MFSHQFEPRNIGMWIIQAFWDDSNYQISLSSQILLALWMINVFVSIRTTQLEYPHSCFEATLRWHSFINTRKGTAAVDVPFFALKVILPTHMRLLVTSGDAHQIPCEKNGCKQCWFQQLWTVLRGQSRSKLVAPSRMGLCTQYSFFLMHFLLSIPSCSVYSILTTAFPPPLLFNGLFLFVSKCLSQTGHKPNEAWAQAELLNCTIFE